MAGQLILALAILVTFHELGHYLAARAFGIRVEKFYLFFDAFGKKLFSFKKGDTEYGIGWLPIGGYVKISGMIDESVDTEQMKSEPQPWEFRSKPAWQRFIVMIGGIVVNLILGYVFYLVVLLGFQKDYVTMDTVNQHGIIVGPVAEAIGFEEGDKLISLNGETHKRFRDYSSLEAMFGGDMVVERDGEQKTITIPSDYFKVLKNNKGAFIDCRSTVWVKELSSELDYATQAGMLPGDEIISINDTALKSYSHMVTLLWHAKEKTVPVVVKRGGEEVSLTSQVDTGGRLGFRPKVIEYPNERTAYTFGSAIKYSFKESWDVIYYNVVGLGKIFSGDVPAKEVKSIIGMASFFGAKWDWQRFWSLTAMISLALAFMNALPIPALDGGHMVFLTYEMIVGKPAPERVLLVAQYIGMAILLTLMALTMGNDIWQIIKSKFL